MEKVKYSFQEQYHEISREKRINRKQFFVRSIVGGLLFWFCTTVITGVFSDLISSFPIRHRILFSTILGIALGLVYLYKVLLILIKKRAHDFGSDGKVESLIIQILIFMYYIIFGLLILQTYYIGSEILPAGFSYLEDYIYWIMPLLLFVYLLFRRGNIGSNKYGDDTSNIKIGFLG